MICAGCSVAEPWEHRCFGVSSGCACVECREVEDIMSETKSTDWIICVSGYGSFPFVGTEAEAEKMRVHKANWEHGVGKKHSPDETCSICERGGTRR